MTKKTHDLAVKVGEYEKDGQTKNRYQNIGMILEKDDGGRFMLLNRSFNPAGVPFKEGSETIMVSMFSVKSGEQNEDKTPPTDDDIPF
jgi:hypothetical protein